MSNNRDTYSIDAIISNGIKDIEKAKKIIDVISHSPAYAEIVLYNKKGHETAEFDDESTPEEVLEGPWIEGAKITIWGSNRGEEKNEKAAKDLMRLLHDFKAIK